MGADERTDYGVILFDLDGTLTDPKEGIVNSVKYALSKLDIEEKNPDSLEAFIGPPLQETFRIFYGFNKEKVAEAIKHFREYFSAKGMYENHLYPQIPELLSGLEKIHKKIGIATSKPTVFAEKIAEYFGIVDYFSFIVGANLDGTMVQKTDIIKYILTNYLKEENGNVIMIGDRGKDITGARENNMDSIGVLWGYGKREEIAEANPTHTVDSVEELTRFFGIRVS